MYALCKSTASRPKSTAFPDTLVINQIQGGTEPEQEKIYNPCRQGEKGKCPKGLRARGLGAPSRGRAGASAGFSPPDPGPFLGPPQGPCGVCPKSQWRPGFLQGWQEALLRGCILLSPLPGAGRNAGSEQLHQLRIPQGFSHSSHSHESQGSKHALSSLPHRPTRICAAVVKSSPFPTCHGTASIRCGRQPRASGRASLPTSPHTCPSSS